MSKFSFRPRGGMNGIEVSKFELGVFANFIGRKHIDEVIPLPNMEMNKQAELIKNCKVHSESFYYETETGSHGWCCSKCGTVTQGG